MQGVDKVVESCASAVLVSTRPPTASTNANTRLVKILLFNTRAFYSVRLVPDAAYKMLSDFLNERELEALNQFVREEDQELGA
jgi:hypothetical protein